MGCAPRLAAESLKPPPERLYGRARGHALRARQRLLLDVTLPRLRAGPFPVTTGENWLEIGFGGGEHALAQIAAHPEATLMACEVFENGICSLLSRLVPEGGEASAPLPDNLRLWPDDARALLRGLPDACLDRVFLLFPDPWPKTRHAKRRFVHPANLATLARVMKPGAEWRVASDHPIYQTRVEAVMATQSWFDTTPPTATRPEDWPATRYEAKALREGWTPLYWRFTRRR
jgi:tRNA (guanine-N7-)-methyltransferase